MKKIYTISERHLNQANNPLITDYKKNKQMKIKISKCSIKYSLITILLLVLMLGISDNNFGQTTITIGSGTATQYYLPIRTYYGYSYTQQIYTKAQINTAGYIEKIRFYYSSGSTTNSNAWVIYMGHTTKTSFTSTSNWISVGSLTEVFNGTVSFPGAAGWMEITLSTPFSYNNSNNLVIAIDENTSSYSANDAYWRSFTSGSNTGIYYYNDDTNPNPSSPPTAISRTSNINQIQVVFAATNPTLIVNPQSLDFGYASNGNTLEKSYSLSGINLSGFPGNIVVTAPAGFHVSLTSDSGFTSSVNVPYSSATLASTPVYVQFAPTGSPADYSGNITNAGGGATTQNVAVTGTSTALTYCTTPIYSIGSATCANNFGITNVSFSDMSNPTACNGTSPYYTYYSTPVATVEQGSAYTLSVSLQGTTSYITYIKAYIDLNQNGIFDEEGEEIFNTGNVGGLAGPYSTSYTIPVLTPNGTYRMRVRSTDSDVNSCTGDGIVGEVEDYEIIINSGVSCQAPYGLTQTSSTDITATVEWLSAADEFEIEYGEFPYTFTGTANVSPNPTTNSHQFSGLQSGTTYEYKVKAICGPGDESDWSVTGTFTTLTCDPISNLTSQVNGLEVTLNWESDAYATTGSTVSWAGDFNGGIGTNAAADFSVAHRYATSDLTVYDGKTLTKVRFIPYVDGSSCTYSVRVWTGGDIYGPSTLIVDQLVSTASIVTEQYNEVILDNPVTVDAAQELWIGYRANTTTGYPAGNDVGPQVAGKGNMVLWSGVWQQLTDLNAALTYNWCIQGFIADDGPFNVYRNDVFQQTITSKQYVDNLPSAGNYNYCIEVDHGYCISPQVCELIELCTPPSINGQPVSSNITYGSPAYFEVATTNATSYQWEEYTTSWNPLSNGGIYSGVNTAELQISKATVAMNGNKYRCTISGSCAPDATSDGNATLSVTAKDLTVTANTGQFKYETQSDPILTYSASGFVSGEDEGVLTGTLSRDGGEAVGNYAITLGTLDADNYSISFNSTDFEIKPAYEMEITAYLQGTYGGGGMMSTTLRDAGQIPTNQPFNAEPWYYNGSETLPTPLPTDVVDWVLVELRSDENTTLEKKAGLLYNDGSIRVSFTGSSPAGDYVVVWHRNHMPVMSIPKSTLPIEGAQFDLTASANLYGTNPAIDLGGGVSGMIAGDITHNGVLQYTGRATTADPSYKK